MDQHHPVPNQGPADRSEPIHTPFGALWHIEGDEALAALRAMQPFCRWNAARDCALQLFGPKAVRVLIRIEWMGDDVSGYEPFARRIIACHEPPHYAGACEPLSAGRGSQAP